MSQQRPERPGTARFIEALGVRRNAAIGFALGFVLAAFFTYGAVAGPDVPFFGLTGTRADAAALALGFVLAVGTGLLATVVLTLASAVRLARED